MAYPNGGLHAAGIYEPSNPERLAAARADVLRLANARRAPHDAVNLCLEDTILVTEAANSKVHQLVRGAEQQSPESSRSVLAKFALAHSVPIIRALELGFTDCKGDWDAVRRADAQLCAAQDWLTLEPDHEYVSSAAQPQFYIEPNVIEEHGYINLRVQQEVYSSQTYALLPHKTPEYEVQGNVYGALTEDSNGASFQPLEKIGEVVLSAVRQNLHIARLDGVGYKRSEFVVDLARAQHQGGDLWREIHDICVESEQTHTLLRLADSSCNVPVHTGDQVRQLNSAPSIRVLQKALGEYASAMLSPVAVTYFHTNTVKNRAPIGDDVARAEFGLTSEELDHAYEYGAYVPQKLVPAGLLP